MKVEVETTLAKTLTATEGMNAYDAVCKRLLVNRQILAWIMKSCLEEYREMERKDIEACIEGEPQIGAEAVFPDEEPEANRTKRSEQIRGANVEDSTIREQTNIYDIRFYATAPGEDGLIEILINLEIQNDYHAGYPLIKRALYYCCRMISSQYGKEFVHQDYGNIKKVYSIWLTLEPPKSRQNTITRYVVREENIIGDVAEKREYYDLLTAVMIGLGDEEGEQCQGVLKLLEVLLSSEKAAEEKTRVLSEEFAITMTEILEGGIYDMCNLSKGVEQKGFRRGMEQGVLRSIQNLMETLHLTAEQAMDALKVEGSKRNEYAEQLKAN